MLPKAKIAVTNLDTGTQSSVESTTAGLYTVTSLPAGKYQVEVSAPGFKSLVQTGITVSVAQTAQMNLTLSVGSVNETITVTSDATQLKTENAEQSTTIDRNTLNELPIGFAQTNAIRDPMAFSKLAPGTYISPGSNTNLRVNGLPLASFHIAVDGMDSTNANLQDREDGDHPSIEMLQEFTLQSSNFSAEFSQVGGGLFNFTERSGTNSLHGSAYENFVNEDLNAGIPYSRATTPSPDNSLVALGGPNKRPGAHQNDFGFTIGGTVIVPRIYDGRDKTFFFNLELYRQNNTYTCSYCAVPTDNMRKGDFSAILTGVQLATDILGRPVMQNAIYDPSTARTGEVNGNSYVVTDPFPGNVISDIDPVAAKVQSLIPEPTNPSATALNSNWQPSVTYPKTYSIPAFKIDHVVSNAVKASFYYSNDTGNTPSSVDGLPFPISAERTTENDVSTYRLNTDYTVTPNLLVHAGAGYTRYINRDSAPPSVFNYDAATELGLHGAVGPGFPHFGGFPTNRSCCERRYHRQRS